jgi:nucleoid-associated protein YgaU
LHRITGPLLALAAAITVLLGVGALQYVWLELKPSAPSSVGHAQAPTRIPTASPGAAPPAALPLPSSPAPPAGAAPEVPAGAPAMDPKAGATTITYVVQPHDTLWDLAGADLGNPLRWQELYDLNRGRPEPDGQALTNSNLIYPGWTLEFPADAEGLPAPQAPTGWSGGRSA